MKIQTAGLLRLSQPAFKTLHPLPQGQAGYEHGVLLQMDSTHSATRKRRKNMAGEIFAPTASIRNTRSLMPGIYPQV